MDTLITCERVSENSSYVAAEAYPEFSEFKIHMAEETFRSDEPVEGYVTLGLKDGYENSVNDVVIECKGIFYVTFSATQMREVEQVYLSTQRGASPLNNGGDSLASGTYDFPFSFRIPNEIPGTLCAGEHYSDWNTDGGKLYFKIRAYVIPDENSKLKREILTISEYFNRVIVRHPTPSIQPHHFGSKKYLLGNSEPLEAKVTLNQDSYFLGEELRIGVDVINNANVNVKGITVKVMQEMSTYASKRSKAFPSLGAGESKIFRKFCLAKEGTSIGKQDFVKGKFSFLTGLTPERTSSGCVCSDTSKTRLSSSTLIGHENGTVTVEYYVSVEIYVRLGNTLRVKVPFFMSSVEYSEYGSLSSGEIGRNAPSCLPRYSFESTVSDFEFMVPSMNRSNSLTYAERMSDVDIMPASNTRTTNSLRKRALTFGAQNIPQLPSSDIVPTSPQASLEIVNEGTIPAHVYRAEELDSKTNDSASLPLYDDVIKSPSRYHIPHSLPVKPEVSRSQSVVF